MKQRDLKVHDSSLNKNHLMAEIQDQVHGFCHCFLPMILFFSPMSEANVVENYYFPTLMVGAALFGLWFLSIYA